MASVGRTLALWAPPLLLMAVIFALSAMPSDGEDKGPIVLVLRKIGHFSEYALLMLLWWRVLRTKLDARVAIASAVAICVLYAAGDEWHQRFVEGRGPSPVDVGIDSAGAATMAALIAARGRVRSA